MVQELRPAVAAHLRDGVVIPAHPLALDASRKLDERRQRGLTRYYLAAGAGGVAVGVHTTQFAIRDREINLLEPVLRLAVEEVERAGKTDSFIKVAGICGPTPQALHEAELAARLGYDLGLVSMGGLHDWSEADLLRRTEEIAKVIPVFGFYLQPAVGGRELSGAFWREFAEIPGVMAVKLAPFNRYQTLDVVRAVCRSSRRDDIALYTGNDDNIVADLLTTYRVWVDGRPVEKRIVGGAARPLGGLDACGGAAARRDQAGEGERGDPGRTAGSRDRRHGRQCRLFRPRSSVCRVHPRHPRSAAAAGAPRRAMVPSAG